MKMITRLFFLFAITLLLASCAVRQGTGETTFKPKDGYVPDAEVAKQIAQAVWTPIYGKEQIERERPFVATLSKGVWTVTGSLPEGSVGGVAEIDIRQEDGKILRLIHGQ